MSDTWIATELCNLGEVVDGLTVDDNGYIYFTIYTKSTVYRIHHNNTHIKPTNVFQKETQRLEGIVWNRNNNNLYICDYGNCTILEYSLDTGNLSTLAGNEEWGHKDGNFKDAILKSPLGIATDKNGDLFTTDSYCVRKINLSEGTVITIAGSDEFGHKDGEVNQAKFENPFGLVVSGDGTIYVADSSCIRKIKDGIVSTIAGTSGKVGYQDGPLNQSLFKYLVAIALDVEGNLLVGDWNGIRKVDLNNQIVSTLIKTYNRVFCIYQLDAHTIIVGAEENLLKLECSWKWERFLWIGNKKENSSYCHLASLPKDIIREIANYVRSPLR